MEIKHAMNTSTTASLQAQSNEGKIAITDATAVFAWCETQDEAAGLWLCEKYRPLVTHAVARETRDFALRAYLVDEALRVGLSEMDAQITISRVGAWFARIALQVCQQAAEDLEDCVMLAA